MAINVVQNKRNGPGGSARRLHQFTRKNLWGRNRIDVRGKGTIFARHGTTVIGLILQMLTIMKHLR